MTAVHSAISPAEAIEAFGSMPILMAVADTFRARIERVEGRSRPTRAEREEARIYRAQIMHIEAIIIALGHGHMLAIHNGEREQTGST